MDVLVYSRDAPGTEALRADRELLERHWSYMDGFAATMIARGPTLTPDRKTATGSLHVLGLPGPEEARAFVAEEPNQRAGLYAEHLLRRFDNLLGRTMWEFRGSPGGPLFLVLAPGGRPPAPPGELPAALRGRLILYGGLRTLDEGEPAGLALALQAESRQAAERLLAEAGLDGAEIHDWEFGGRR